MKCHRCGYCCVNYCVMVVNPKYADQDDIIFDFENPIKDLLIYVDHEKQCPYIYWSEEQNQAVCKVHEKKWFSKTPCYRHNNIETIGKCRIGEYIINNKDILEKHKEKFIKIQGEIPSDD